MKRPTLKSNYTKQDLVDYAVWRSDEAMKDLQKAQKIREKDENYEDNEKYQELYRDPLAIDKVSKYTIELSTGGDADGFIIEIDYIGMATGKYYWADWGVYEEVELSPEETDQIIEFYDLFTCEHV